LVSVVKSLPSFHHSGRTGAFRSWLRSIAGKRLSDYWRSRDPHEAATGGSVVAEMLSEVADAESEQNRRRDEEHDRHVLRCLFELEARRLLVGRLASIRTFPKSRISAWPEACATSPV
jgi:DNA-directed RNA polymerase specialized sigma24 family protein